MKKTLKFINRISKKRIVKRHSIQINIPTFNSYQTKKIITILKHQQNISFDILLIDNNSLDYKKLIKDFPDINYVVLNDNYGGGGAQRIGAELALKYKYQYIVFSDNDAILMDKYGLSKLKKKLDSDKNLLAALPKNIEYFVNKKNDFYTDRCPFHFFIVRTVVFNKIDLHNFYLYLFSDDISLSYKISTIGKILICADVEYYHNAFTPKILTNFYNYFSLRGFLIIIFKEKDIALRYKFQCLLMFFSRLLRIAVKSIIFMDLSYLKTFFLSVIGFIFENKNLIKHIPKNKYILKEIKENKLSKNILKNALNITINSRTKHYFELFFLAKYCYIWNNYKRKKIYFELVHSSLDQPAG